MHRKQLRVTARAVAMGGTVVLGLGCTQAAMAGSLRTVVVPCYSGALASAISDASSGETIVLTPGCVYHLNTALPAVSASVTIEGYGAELLRGNSAPPFPLLTVDASVDFTVVDVNFKNGGGSGIDGGAIYNEGASTVNVDGGVFTDNYAGDDYGGAIANWSTRSVLTVTGATFVDNTTPDYGGAIYNYGTATVYGSDFKNTLTDDDGGAIYNEGTMQVIASTFTGITSYDGAIYNYSGDDLALTRDAITGNSAVYGAGVYNDGGTVVVNGSLIAFNRATDDGGGIYNWEGTARALGNQIYGNQPDNCVSVQGC
jgi:hypothetical protein